MSNDEKMCPLTKMTCYGTECAWWRVMDCAVTNAVRELNYTSMELFHIRNELTSLRCDISELEKRL